MSEHKGALQSQKQKNSQQWFPAILLLDFTVLHSFYCKVEVRDFIYNTSLSQVAALQHKAQWGILYLSYKNSIVNSKVKLSPCLSPCSPLQDTNGGLLRSTVEELVFVGGCSSTLALLLSSYHPQDRSLLKKKRFDIALCYLRNNM